MKTPFNPNSSDETEPLAAPQDGLSGGGDQDGQEPIEVHEDALTFLRSRSKQALKGDKNGAGRAVPGQGDGMNRAIGRVESPPVGDLKLVKAITWQAVNIE